MCWTKLAKHNSRALFLWEQWNFAHVLVTVYFLPSFPPAPLLQKTIVWCLYRSGNHEMNAVVHLPGFPCQELLDLPELQSRLSSGPLMVFFLIFPEYLISIDVHIFLFFLYTLIVNCWHVVMQIQCGPPILLECRTCAREWRANGEYVVETTTGCWNRDCLTRLRWDFRDMVRKSTFRRRTYDGFYKLSRASMILYFIF